MTKTFAFFWLHRHLPSFGYSATCLLMAILPLAFFWLFCHLPSFGYTATCLLLATWHLPSFGYTTLAFFWLHDTCLLLATLPLAFFWLHCHLPSFGYIATCFTGSGLGLAGPFLWLGEIVWFVTSVPVWQHASYLRRSALEAQLDVARTLSNQDTNNSC